MCSGEAGLYSGNGDVLSLSDGIAVSYSFMCSGDDISMDEDGNSVFCHSDDIDGGDSDSSCTSRVVTLESLLVFVSAEPIRCGGTFLRAHRCFANLWINLPFLPQLRCVGFLHVFLARVGRCCVALIKLFSVLSRGQ